MANNTIGWGQGATNNDIGWGRGSTNDIGWGSVYAESYVGDTDIQGADARFIITIDTTKPGSAADTFVLPWIGTYDVEWGDGNSDVGVSGTQTHTYASAGTYDVAVTAASGQIAFATSGDRQKLIDIKNWGAVEWTSLATAFWGCFNTVVSATDVPNLSFVTSMNLAFTSCSKITNLDVSDWNTSSVTNMSALFSNCTLLKADLSGLDIALVTNFSNFATNTNINETGTTTNYDNTLISWAAQTPQNNIVINFGTAKYSWRAIEARNTLVNDYNWTITDGGFADVSDEFIFSVDTTVAGTSGIGNFQLPLVSSGTIDVIVDWGDGTSDNITTYNQAETLHSYSTAGEYQIKISSRVAGVNPIKGWQFNNGKDKLKMLDIKNWGSFDITVNAGFNGCSNLTQSALDTPTITSTNLFGYFQSCANFNGDISGWDVSLVTDLSYMFINASSFNQNIGNWNTSSTSTIYAMMANADAFDYSLANWDITSLTSATNFLLNATGLSTTNYDATLIAWEANLQATYPAGVGYTASININFGGSKFTLGSAAETARTSLRNTFGWTITDGGGVSGVLNQYTGAAAAYSLRNLSTATTSVVRVRRDSDNAEQDFTYDGIMDVGATGLASWVGVGNGYVVTWYDQSGNGNHATQGTASNQGRLVTSGVVNLLNGMPYVASLSGTIRYYSTYAPNGTGRQVYFVGQGNGTNQGLLGSHPDAPGNDVIYLSSIFPSTVINLNATTSNAVLNGSTFNPSTRLDIYNAFNSTQNILSLDIDFSFVTNILAFGYSNTSFGMFSMQEFVIYPSDQGANRINIENNINGYYNIY